MTVQELLTRRTDLPTLSFRIEGARVADTSEGPVLSSRITWAGESDRSIRDYLEASGENADTRSAVDEAGDWLVDYLESVGGDADSASIKNEGRWMNFHLFGTSDDDAEREQGR